MLIWYENEMRLLKYLNFSSLFSVLKDFSLNCGAIKVFREGGSSKVSLIAASLRRFGNLLYDFLS